MTTTTTPEPQHTCYGAQFLGAPEAVAHRECPACPPWVDWDRDEASYCERGTFGCCVNHTDYPDLDFCETW